MADKSCASTSTDQACAHCKKSGADLEAGNTMKRCGRCRCVFYCCVEHQKADWCKHKASCGSARTSATPAATATRFNVVEILANRCNCPGLMFDVAFPSREAALESLKRRGITEVIPSKHLPLVSLMGFELELHGCAWRDQELNGSCVYLTCPPDTGLSPFQPQGTYYAVPAAGSSTTVTADNLWGVRELILEAMDEVYGSDLPMETERAAMLAKCRQFRKRKWTPKAGNPSQIDFYGEMRDEPAKGQWGHHAMLRDVKRSFQSRAAAWAKEQARLHEQRPKPHELAEMRAEHQHVAKFLQTVIQKLPTKEAVENHLATHLRQFARPYHHELTMQMLRAGALEYQMYEEQLCQLRRIGLELHYLGGFDAMQCSYYAVNHIMCGPQFNQGLVGDASASPAIYCWVRLIDWYWDGVGSWKA